MRIIQYTSIIVLGLALLGSCASGPLEIAEDLTPAELIQRGQEASDRSRYKQSLQYYEAILERFPTDIESICAAEYEIAFIHYKQKRLDESKAEFDALLARYDGPDADYLPPQFKILSEIVMAKLETKQN